jgi:hypothetical protein
MGAFVRASWSPAPPSGAAFKKRAFGGAVIRRQAGPSDIVITTAARTTECNAVFDEYAAMKGDLDVRFASPPQFP